MSGPVAVVDCGTNSTRLLVTHGDADLARDVEVTGLGRGLGATGVLADESIVRVVNVLERYRRTMDELGVVAVRAVGTSAAREAANGAEFLERAGTALRAEVELLSGDDEATYSFAGATAGVDAALGPFLVVDIGGGSTEFAVGSGASPPAFHVSLPLGSVRFTEQFLRRDPPSAAELSQTISVVRAHLDDLDRANPSVRVAPQLVGVAGTVTTIAAVEIGLATYDRDVIDGFVLSRAAAEDVFRTLATESLEDRRWNPGLPPERADVIVGGCCVLVAVMRHFDFDDCLVRDSDLLDGIAAELLGA